eukprot:911937_1
MPKLSPTPVPLVADNNTPNTDYVALHEHTDTITTKYDCSAYIILIGAVLFLITWIGWIIFHFIQTGISTRYCQEPFQSCTFVWSSECCADSAVSACWDPSIAQCRPMSKTISPFVSQLILICLLLFYIQSLIRTLLNGIQIHSVSSNSALNTARKCKDKWTVDCRRCIYCVSRSPHITSTDFLRRSLVMVSIFQLLQHSPVILLNIFSGDDVLITVAVTKLISDLFNLLVGLWRVYSPIHNCCRGRRSGNCCCQCQMSHFPEHHQEYARATAGIVQVGAFTKISGAVAQISAVGFIDSSDPFHLWLTCLNFVVGIICIANLFRTSWRYYYLLCHYWSRGAVNKYEEMKIKEILSDLLVVGYVFKVSIDKDNDEFTFANVVDSETIADKVQIKYDCWVFCIVFQWMIVLVMLLSGMWNCTEALNHDFNAQYSDQFCFVRIYTAV